MAAHAILREALAALSMPATRARVQFEGQARWPSCFPVTDLAAASIGAAGAMIAELIGDAASPPAVHVDRRLASLWFQWSFLPRGWKPSAAWDGIAGDYRARDGWIRLHTNFPHHRAAALAVLDGEDNKEAVGRAVAKRDAVALEEAVVAAGGCAAAMRTAGEWHEHQQGQALEREPLMLADDVGHGEARDWQSSRARPLAGIRVLDLTRVLAGPIATRFLAGFGAEVLRIDPPGWDEPGVMPEVMPGKRSAAIDLRTIEGRSELSDLIAGADILVHGYRPGALDRLGLGAGARHNVRPGLIDVSLSAYGHSGPWAGRRGFDSLVQMSSGIAAAGAQWRGSDAPVPLPVQALDHATGYLMAAAAVRGLIARRSGAGPLRWRLSLARTARLLMEHRGEPFDGPRLSACEDDYAPEVEQMPWGPALRLRPPVRLEGAAMRWERPAGPLGSDEPAWLPGRMG